MFIFKNFCIVFYLFFEHVLVLYTAKASFVDTSTVFSPSTNMTFHSSSSQVNQKEAVAVINKKNFNSHKTQNSTNFLCEHKPTFRLGSAPLLTYLLRLRFCQEVFNRSWLEEECSDETFSFSKYNELVYAKFCDPSLYAELCQRHTRIHNLAINSSSFNGENLTSSIFTLRNVSGSGDDTSAETRDTAKNHLYCDAVESYFDALLTDGFVSKTIGSKQAHLPFYNVKYTEWFLTFRDFCYPASCGVSQKNYENRSLTAYDCYSTSCNTVMVVDMFVDGILALCITTANALVLLVAFCSSAMKNIPGYFKISLACADLLIGLFVLPCVIYNHYVLLFEPLPYRNEGQEPKVTDYFSQTYVNFTGIVIFISIFTSVYTLGLASVDRYLAVIRPFRYQKGKYFTKKKAILVLAGVWILGFICSILPLFHSAHSYTISAIDLTLAAGAGVYTIILYASLLGFALLSMWIINIAMIVSLHLQRRKSRLNKSVIKSMLFYGRTRSTSTTLPRNGDAISSVVMLSYKRTTEEETRNELKENDNNTKKCNLQPGRESTLSANRSSILKAASTNENARLALTLGIMVGTYTITLLPCIVLLSLLHELDIDPIYDPENFSKKAMYDYASMEYVFVRWFLFNSFWNCVIYSIRNVRFREAVVVIFTWNEDKRRQKRANINAT